MSRSEFDANQALSASRIVPRTKHPVRRYRRRQMWKDLGREFATFTVMVILFGELLVILAYLAHRF